MIIEIIDSFDGSDFRFLPDHRATKFFSQALGWRDNEEVEKGGLK